jgi:hypothetical protein
LAPRSDAELLPVLLELIGSAVPVDRWPTQMSKAQRREHAREQAQAEAAAADHRPAAAVGTDDTESESAEVVALRWPQRARDTQASLDAERRRRREAVVRERPTPPPPLGASYRKNNVFVLARDEEDEHDD